jgi:hypothetical protein
MNLQIAELFAEAEKISVDAENVFAGLSGKQINWKPNAKVWSVGQCFEHLIVTYNLYFPNIQKVLDGTHHNNFFSKIPFATDLTAFLMKNSLNPNQKRKMKTFKMFEPAKSDISETIINDFIENQQKLTAMITAAENFDLRKIKIAEPLSPALNLRLGDAFEILLMHEQRHFLQAERITKETNFPK